VIPLSRRHAVTALALCAVVALLLGFRQARVAAQDPCHDPEQLRYIAAFGPKHTFDDDVEWRDYTQSRFSLWAEGSLPAAPGYSMQFRFVRGFDPYPFYGGLGKFFFHTQLPEDHTETRTLAAGSDVLTVRRRVNDATGQVHLTQYFFAYGARPVAHPLPAGLRNAFGQLVHGAQPIALFLVSGSGNKLTRADLEHRADTWLSTVWSQYREACWL
jgi:hypothetical protein